MNEVLDDKLNELVFEVLHMERKNLRSKTKSDARMTEEIVKSIVAFSRNRLKGEQDEI